MNVTEALDIFAQDSINVGKQEVGTSALNKSHDKFQANKDKAQTSQLLYLERRKVNGQTNQ